MKRLVVVLLVVGLVATVVLIRPWEVIGKPSQADCRTVTQNRILKANLGQIVEIVSFRTSDSYTFDFMGTKVYVVSFELEVRYLDQLDRDVKLSTESSIAVSNYLVLRSGPKGTLRRISEEMEFLKTDRGWRGQDGKFY